MTAIHLEGALAPEFSPSAYLVEGTFTDPPLDPPAAPSIDDAVKAAVRSLLRFGGYKPSGRGRPASESLAKAVEDGRWPSIHPLVDECNRLSLASGLPISALDADLLQGNLRVRIGQPGESYVFNPSGQELDLKGLLLLADESGPTGSPVKDAQRSKISAETGRFLILVWATSAAPAARDLVEQGLRAWCSERSTDCQEIPTLA